MGADASLLKLILEASLVAKLVLLVLVAASVYSWAIIFTKYKILKELKKNDQQFYIHYKASKSFDDVMNHVRTSPPSPMGMLFEKGHGEFAKLKTEAQIPLREHFSLFGFGLIERALQSGAKDVQETLGNKLPMLASIGSISPFIGLFGTVWGIIHSFQGLSGGGATLDAVAPGIAEALIATAIGLLAAIPEVWYYNYFSNENQKVSAGLEKFAEEFLSTLERSMLKKSSGN